MNAMTNLALAIAVAGIAISTLAIIIASLVSNRYALKHAVLQSALCGLLMAPALAIAYGYWNVSWLRWSVESQVTLISDPTPSIQDQSNEISEMRTVIDRDPIELPANNVDAASLKTTDPEPAPNDINSPVLPTATHTNEQANTATPQPTGSDLRWMDWLLASWAMGIAIGFSRVLIASIRVQRLKRNMRPIADCELVSSRLLASKSLAIAQHVPVMSSAAIQSPIVVGIWKPVVVMPTRLIHRLSTVELADVLVHEVAHIIRRDNLTILLQRIVASIYWPLPTVHWLNRVLEDAREELCDNSVLQSRDAIDYGLTLQRLGELVLAERAPSMSAGILQRAGKLELRIERLLRPTRSTKIAASRFVGLSMLALFLGCSALLASCSLRAQDQERTEVVTTDSKPTLPIEDRDIGTPEFAGNFFGQVFDTSGVPLAGVKIYATKNVDVSKGERIDAMGPVRAITDDHGRFDFHADDMTYQHYDGLKARRETLIVAAKEGLGPDWIVAWGHNSEQGSHWNPYKGAKLEFHLAKSVIDFRGRLLQSNGQPLSNAKVYLEQVMMPPDRNVDEFVKRWQSAGDFGGFLSSGPEFEKTLYTPNGILEMSIETQTDADGNFVLSGLPSDRFISLRITAPEIVDTNIIAITRDTPTVSTKGNESFIKGPERFIYGSGFVLTTQPGLTIRGRVVDSQTKQGVEGMWVGPLRNIVSDLTPDLYPWRTDKDGRFTITGLDPAILELPSAQKPQGRPPHYQMIVAATTPGLPYETAWGYIKKSANGEGTEEMTIEVEGHIPFHLKLVDEVGQPVDADVTYVDIVAESKIFDEVTYPPAHAEKNADGTYTGFVLRGPGAILVKTNWRDHYRAAKVDPNEFFASRRKATDPMRGLYGTTDTLQTHQGRYLDVFWRGNVINQREYSAIILVNPPADSSPLELTATLHRYQPREVYLFGPDNKLLSGVRSTIESRGGMSDYVRSSSFELTDLSDDRDLEVTFSHQEPDNKDSELVALAIVRENGPAKLGDLAGRLRIASEDPRSFGVQLLKPAKFTGRVVNEQGQAIDGVRVYFQLAEGKSFNSAASKEDGRFMTGTIYPGHRYRMELKDNKYELAGHFDELVLAAGEQRDVGDIVVRQIENGTAK